MRLPSGRWILVGFTLVVGLLVPFSRFMIAPYKNTSIESDTDEGAIKATGFTESSVGVSETSSTNAPYSTVSSSIHQENISDFDITIVTLYVNIGKFQKGGRGHFFNTNTYLNWMVTWSWLTNRVVAFFDQDEMLEMFRKVRSSQPDNRTVLFKLNRTDFQAFTTLDKVRAVFRSPGYPKHHPNTVVAEYSLAMSAKYDALHMAISRGLVPTKYVAWLDIGYFRHLIEPKLRPKQGMFKLEVPDNFDSTRVGMSEVQGRNSLKNYSPKELIWKNVVWTAGGFALATKEVMLTFIDSYRKTAADLLSKNLASTDQQVIGAMYSPDYIQQQKVNIQTYRCYRGQFGLNSGGYFYFCLGFHCKDAAEKRQQKPLKAGGM